MEGIREYVHKVQYYETDKMGVTHHSNYVRWMEEARVDLLAQIGWDYVKLEKMGIVSPIIGVTCEFKQPTTFADEVTIHVAVKEVGGVSLSFAYTMTDRSGTEVCTGTSSHAFLNREGKPVRLRREYPGLYEALSSLQEETEA